MAPRESHLGKDGEPICQALRMSLVKLSGLYFSALQSCEGALESRKLSPGGYFNIILQNADDN